MPEIIERPIKAGPDETQFRPGPGLNLLEQKLLSNDKKPSSPTPDIAVKPPNSEFKPKPPQSDNAFPLLITPVNPNPGTWDRKPPVIDRTPPAVKPDLPLIVPPIVQPIGDKLNKPADKPPALRPGPDGKIELSDKDFDLIGPKAKQVLNDAGVTKMTITPHNGYDTYEAEFKAPLRLPQDPSVDGTRALKLDTHFQADVRKGSDGTLMLDNIHGLTAESKILFQFREAEVQKIQLKQMPDGLSQITSTGSWNGHSGTKTRSQPAEVFDKASILFDRMQKLKTGTMEIPPLPGR